MLSLVKHKKITSVSRIDIQEYRGTTTFEFDESCEIFKELCGSRKGLN